MLDIPLSLYVHFPWCVKKCPYCDFNSHTAAATLPEKSYVDALIQDFSQQLSNLDARQIDTIFMGGGTPSLIAPSEIKRLIDLFFASGRVKKDAEITLEANPGALDASHFDAYLRAGINRISIGVQSFDDQALRKLGRIHTASDAKKAVMRAQQAGFKAINLDLMYALPGQSIRDAYADIEQVLDSDVSHVSLYQLTIEPNTQFAVKPPALPDSEIAWDMHEQAQIALSKAGFERYEVSAYCRASSVCQHNLNYWQFGDYLAIGAGAHGKLSTEINRGSLDIHRSWNHRHPKRYLQASAEPSFSASTKQIIQEERDFEYLMNSLRLRTGFDLVQYETRTSGSAAALLQLLEPYIRKAWLKMDDNQGRIFPTEEGYRFIDTILLDCLPERK